LPEVTGMLQRVYSSAYHADEFNAAHNAALSLARLYGHVNDRQTIDIIRRPSRDPDAPSEQDLSTWVESLPAINAPDGFSHSVIAPAPEGSEASGIALGGPPHRAPAPLLATPADTPTPVDNLATPRDSAIDWTASRVLPTSATARDIPSDINDLPTHSRLSPHNSAAPHDVYDVHDRHDTPGRPENGAPARPVTGTPNARAHAEPLRGGHPGVFGKGSPAELSKVPGTTGEKFPPIEDLF
jgi:hypothetical protein